MKLSVHGTPRTADMGDSRILTSSLGFTDLNLRPRQNQTWTVILEMSWEVSVKALSKCPLGQKGGFPPIRHSPDSLRSTGCSVNALGEVQSQNVLLWSFCHCSRPT